MHYLVSIAAGIPLGAGSTMVLIGIQNYLVDAYTIYAASVQAGGVFLRLIFAAVFPAFLPYMYSSLGIHWASSIPAFLAVLCMPLPFLFYKYGQRSGYDASTPRRRTSFSNGPEDYFLTRSHCLTIILLARKTGIRRLKCSPFDLLAAVLTPLI